MIALVDSMSFLEKDEAGSTRGRKLRRSVRLTESNLKLVHSRGAGRILISKMHRTVRASCNGDPVNQSNSN